MSEHTETAYGNSEIMPFVWGGEGRKSLAGKLAKPQWDVGGLETVGKSLWGERGGAWLTP